MNSLFISSESLFSCFTIPSHEEKHHLLCYPFNSLQSSPQAWQTSFLHSSLHQIWNFHFFFQQIQILLCLSSKLWPSRLTSLLLFCSRLASVRPCTSGSCDPKSDSLQPQPLPCYVKETFHLSFEIYYCRILATRCFTSSSTLTCPHN